MSETTPAEPSPDAWEENRRLLASIARSAAWLLALWTGRLRALALERAVELAVVAALLFNAFAFLALSHNLRNSAGRYVTACVDHADVFSLGNFGVVTNAIYYPPLHYVWMALCPWATWPISPPWLLLWSNLLVVLGWAGVSSALRNLGAPREARWAAALLLAGYPLTTAFTCTLHTDSALIGFAGLLLWCLAGATEMPSNRRCAALGAVLGLSMLTKWTFVLAAAGPIAIAAASLAARHRRWSEWVRCILWVAIPAAAIAGPWYAFVLDWQRLAATVANDNVLPGLTGWARHRVAYPMFASQLAGGLGSYLGIATAVGIALAVFKRLPGAWLALSCALGPLLVLPTLPHFEERYLLACLPGIALAAGLGLGTLGRRRSGAAVALIAIAAAIQVLGVTWSGALRERERSHVGPGGSHGDDFVMHWPRWRSVENVRNRVAFWGRQMGVLDRPVTYAIHPFEANPDVREELLVYLEQRDTRESQSPRLAGYDFSSYRAFYRAVQQPAVDFILISEETLAAHDDDLDYWAANGWSFVPLSGAAEKPPAERPPEDALLLGPMTQNYGTIETYHDGGRPIYILARRELWQAVRNAWPLCGLPDRRLIQREY